MRKIYLSPHLDDAILSCGGIIFEDRKAGIHVEIWNFMCGIPPSGAPLSDLARSVHAGWNLDTAKEVADLRLAEDRLSASRVDALPRYFGFLDSIYRRDENGKALYNEDIFLPPHPADADLVDEMAKVIEENLQTGDMVICPLSIGNHPDHVLVRQAAEKLAHKLYYYADIPYALWYPDKLIEMTERLKGERHQVSEDGARIWQEAVSAYASQIDVLFGDEEMMRRALKLEWGTSRSIKLFSKP